MNKKITDIFSSFRQKRLKNDRQVIVFSICLLIATVLWFLNALSKDYTTTINYPIKFINSPKNLFLVNNPPSKLELTVKAHGFTLLRHKIAFSFSPIVFDLKEINRDRYNKDSNYIVIQTKNLIKNISNQVSKEMSVIDIFPKTISFIFDSLMTKSVPVKPHISFDLKLQYNLNRQPFTEPESISVMGPTAILDTIDYLYTEQKYFRDLDAPLKENIQIEYPKNIKLSTEKVNLIIPVEKFTEKNLSFPIKVINLPEETDLKLFPPDVSVSFMVGLSNYDKISADDFNIFVDYQQIKTDSETLDIIVNNTPSFIQKLKIIPEEVEFLIEKK